MKNRCYSRGITKNKSFEVELNHFPEGCLFDFRFKINNKADHAGFEFHLEIMRVYFSFVIYDNRHWNYDENRWYEYGKEPWGDFE